MREVILDGSKIDSKEQLHRFLKNELELPDYYGGNLDALWDCLTDEVVTPLTIRWLHYSQSKAKLGDYCDQLRQLFQDAEEELDGFSLSLE